MKLEIKVNKDTMKVIGNGAVKIGKSIVVEGTKAVALKGAAAVITQGFDEGFGKVNELTLDDMLKGGKKNNKPKEKKKLFSFKKKDEGVTDKVELEVETVEVVDAEIVEDDKKK